MLSEIKIKIYVNIYLLTNWILSFNITSVEWWFFFHMNVKTMCYIPNREKNPHSCTIKLFQKENYALAFGKSLAAYSWYGITILVY